MASGEILVRDKDGSGVFCDPDEINFFVFGQMWDVNWYTVSQGSEGTIVQTTRQIPDSAFCAIQYKPISI